jgi:hypothetical protein
VPEAGDAWLRRILSQRPCDEVFLLQAMASIRAAEWRRVEHEPRIRALGADRRPSSHAVDCALSSARLLPRAHGAWHEVSIDAVEDDPVRVAAVLSARLLLRPDDARAVADVRRLWKRCKGSRPLSSYADGSIFFGPCLAFHFARAPMPPTFAARVRAIYDESIDGTRAEGLGEVALFTIFGALAFSERS